MSKPAFVFDTNTLVSALLFRNSIPRQAFDKALETGQILLSLDVLYELNDVLGREKFKKYINEDERIEFLSAFLQNTTMIDITEGIQECRDPKDDKFLELAVNGNATCIVSGDKDLLVLHPFRGIEIFSARDFLEK